MLLGETHNSLRVPDMCVYFGWDHCALSGCDVHVSNTDAERLERSNVQHNVADQRTHCSVRCHLFHILSSLCHAGKSDPAPMLGVVRFTVVSVRYSLVWFLSMFRFKFPSDSGVVWAVLFV